MMKVVRIDDVEEFVTSEGTLKPLLFSEHVSLLHFEIPPLLEILPHAHPRQVILYCLDGELEVVCEGESSDFSRGMALMVSAGAKLGLKNREDKPVRLLAISSPPFTTSLADFKEMMKDIQRGVDK